MRRWISVIMAMAIAICATDSYAQSHYATKQAQESYDNGIKLERRSEEKGDMSFLKDAEKEYRQAINAEPNMVQAYIRLGYVLYALNRSSESSQLLQKALEQHPSNVELKHYLGLNLYQSGDGDEAERILSEVVAERKDLPEAFFVLGKINLDNGNPLKAQEYFAQYAAATPNDAHAYRALAAAYIQAKDVNGAETALSHLLSLAPDDVVATINMGHVKFERGQIDEAVKLYEQAYKAEPKRLDILYTIASAYYLSGRYEDAIKQFDRVLEKDQTHMGAEYFKADAMLKLGKLDEAEEAFKALQTKMPDYRYVKLKLAYIRMMRGDNKALDDVRTLIESTQNADDLHFGAVMLRKKGETDESLAIHQRLYDENRNNSLYGVYLAREYLEVSNYTQASELLMALIDDKLDNNLAWEMLSLTLLHQGEDAMMIGEFDQARMYFDQALSMEVHSVQAHCSMAQLGLLEGKPDEAFDSYQAAEQISADAPDVIRLAAQFDMLDGAYDAAVKRLENLRHSQSDDAIGGAGFYLLAVALSNLGKWQEAETALKSAEKAGVIDSPAMAIVALQGAMRDYKSNDYTSMAQYLAKVERYKDGLDDADLVRYYYLSAVLAVRDKKFSAARGALEALKETYDELPIEVRRQITPTGTLDVSFELAYSYYETGNLDSSLSLLSGKSSPAAKSLEAAVRRKFGYQALKNKKYESALDNYNRLNSLGGATTADQYNAVLARLQARQLTHADEVLEKYAKQGIPEAVLNYAIYLDTTGNGAKATQYYEKYVAIASSRKSGDVKSMLTTKQRVWGDNLKTE